MSNEQVLPAELVDGAIRHMNEDHAHNLLDYARVLAGLNWAEKAQMSTLDVTGFDLIVRGGGRVEAIRITFDTPLTSADQLRPKLVALARLAKQDTSNG